MSQEQSFGSKAVFVCQKGVIQSTKSKGSKDLYDDDSFIQTVVFFSQ